jgi:hypothetical protein
MSFAEFVGPPTRAEILLRWGDPGRQLALYKFSGDPDLIPSRDQPVERYSGPSEVTATVSVSGYFDALAVAFEKSSGQTPGPTDTQSFELTIRPAP